VSKICEIDRVVGRAISSRRQSAGISLKELGEAIGLTVSGISHVELGNSRIMAGHLWLIAEALGCTVADLYAEAPATTRVDLEFNRLTKRLTKPDLAALVRLVKHMAARP
jgi:transcriptional regulator with XRE-family HTH domain